MPDFRNVRGRPSSDRAGRIWYDGKLVPWRSAATHVPTHSLHYKLAVFEGVRASKLEERYIRPIAATR